LACRACANVSLTLEHVYGLITIQFQCYHHTRTSQATEHSIADREFKATVQVGIVLPIL
jgi:hypothetical protein